jgi:rfaE bifunctional protein nucleotidyltransferase chain/domain
MNGSIGALEIKIQDRDTAARVVSDWKNDGQKVTFTNGCFDLLHYGHIVYLASARALGDKLVVGLNSDESVRKLKGTGRPIQDLKSRTFNLAALSFVDLVVVFPEDTPVNLIEKLRPDVLVKGGDYQPEEIVGAELVLAYGGQVKTLPFIKGYSTSALEQKIKRSGTDTGSH